MARQDYLDSKRKRGGSMSDRVWIIDQAVGRLQGEMEEAQRLIRKLSKRVKELERMVHDAEDCEHSA